MKEKTNTGCTFCTAVVQSRLEMWALNMDARGCVASPASQFNSMLNNLFFSILTAACRSSGKGQSGSAAWDPQQCFVKKEKKRETSFNEREMG